VPHQTILPLRELKEVSELYEKYMKCNVQILLVNRMLLYCHFQTRCNFISVKILFVCKKV